MTILNHDSGTLNGMTTMRSLATLLTVTALAFTTGCTSPSQNTNGANETSGTNTSKTTSKNTNSKDKKTSSKGNGSNTDANESKSNTDPEPDDATLTASTPNGWTTVEFDEHHSTIAFPSVPSRENTTAGNRESYTYSWSKDGSTEPIYMLIVDTDFTNGLIKGNASDLDKDAQYKLLIAHAKLSDDADVTRATVDGHEAIAFNWTQTLSASDTGAKGDLKVSWYRVDVMCSGNQMATVLTNVNGGGTGFLKSMRIRG